MDASQPVRWLGCDCGEQHHALVLLSAQGEIERTWSEVRNHPRVLEDLLREIDRSVGSAQLRVVVEMRRGSGRALYRAAVSVGLEVWAVPPQALQRYRETEGQPRKNDEIDAFLLGRMGWRKTRRCRPVADPQPAERRLCRVSRLYRQQVERQTRVKNHLRSRLLELHPDLVRTDSSSPAWQSRRLLGVLARHPTLVGLAQIAEAEIASWLRTVSVRQRHTEARALRQIAGEIDLCPEELEILDLEIALLVQELEALHRACAELRKHMTRWVQQHPLGPKLLEMPGVGPTTASVLIGELLPLARHASEGKVATYAGVTPLTRQSGQRRGRDRLVRGANKHVLRVLYQSSMSATQHSALDRAYYAKKKAGYAGHPSPHTAAVLALTRQRLRVMYKLMTTEATYDKETLIRSHLERQSRQAA